MLNRLTVLTALILTISFCNAQKITLLSSGNKASLRGLSVVTDQIIWVSGSSGQVGLSADGGKNWKWIQVPHYEKSDFRDIEAFSDQEAVIMGITEPAVVLRTIDGGKNWTTVFQDSSKAVFLDAMDFSNEKAVIVGDPVNGRIFLLESGDRGKSWKKIDAPGFPHAVEGEAFFAASGSNLVLKKSGISDQSGALLLVSGGMKSNLYMNDIKYALQLNQGRETTGANSIAINPWHPDRAVIVGGDFKQDTLDTGNALLISLNPFGQKLPSTPPHGYRSCVEYITGQQLISCGTTGVDFSNDAGMNWKLISREAFHVCRKARSGTAIFLAGPKGSIARLDSVNN